MSTQEERVHGEISSSGIAAFATAAEAASLFAPSGNSADVKASQSMVHYQTNPN